MNLKSFISTCFLMFLCQGSYAQDWMRIHHRYDGVDWSIPLQMDKYKEYEFSEKGKVLNLRAILEEDGELVVPFRTNEMDSIDFAYSLTDDEKGHNKYRPFTMHITTEDWDNIVEKELWLNCHISIDGKGEYSDYSGTGRIRGRGNSSWAWYDKKPYKFKLDEKSKLLGLEKAKNWNLLANYRDVTDIMNVYAFEVARYMGMPYTNHSRFVEVFLNDEYIGTYQLTEKIEVGKNRVNIDEEEGVILSFDKDDGPELSPYAIDNFWSQIYKLPICVKHPEDPTYEQLQAIKADFAKVENAVKAHDYATLDSLADIPSYISMIMIHEYLFNVEIGAPRSMYAFKDKDGKYTFGPVWDWDAAFDFRWSDMTTGHTYFDSYKELVLGTDPVKGSGAYERINMFWRDMFGNSEFVQNYKDQWSRLSGDIRSACWAETQKYIEGMRAEGTYARDTRKWPLVDTQGGWWNSTTYFEPDAEIDKLFTWLGKRATYLDSVVAGYPDGDDEVSDGTLTVVATISKEQTCRASSGYSQSGKITVSEVEVKNYLGGSPSTLVPLNTDGNEGQNTAAGTYGAWFDADGSTVNFYGDSHVYIESNDLYSWSYGCHPQNCRKGDRHTVTMQYRRGNKAVNVKVDFVIQ